MLIAAVERLVVRPAQDSNGSARWVPRWSNRMRSRSALTPAFTHDANSNDPPPPGPPDSTRIGSGFGVADRAGKRTTKMRIIRPSALLLLRFSGTVR